MIAADPRRVWEGMSTSAVKRSATVFAAGRVAYAAALLCAPTRLASGWVGEEAARGPGTIGLRGLAGRDLLASGGALVALRRGRPARVWLLACAIGDLTDTAATLVVTEGLPPRSRWGTVALAGGAAVLGAALAARLDS